MQFDQLKRREFFVLLGGAAAWPLAARAQQAQKLPTIGFSGQSTRSAASEWVAAFTQRLRELDWIEGRTIAIEYRWAEGRSERFAEIAAELVRLKVDVIVTAQSSVPALKQATMSYGTNYSDVFRRRLRRQDSAWDKTRRSPCRAADQVRFRYQPDHRQGARPDCPGVDAPASRRGD
jgi:hypothetical protein